jgi:hypothetical protein
MPGILPQRIRRPRWEYGDHRLVSGLPTTHPESTLSKGPQPKDFKHWLLLALYQRGRCLGWGEMSLRNII